MEARVYIKTENFKIEKLGVDEDSKKSVIFSGLALPLGQESRNKYSYNKESALEAMSSLKNVSFLFNHDESNVLGHVVEVTEEDDGIHYKADIDPEEKDFIRKAERGDIPSVSIGAIIKQVKDNTESGVPECYVKEFIELSAVTVPGFLDTSLNREGFISIESFLAHKKEDKKESQIETNKYSESNKVMTDEDKTKDTDENAEEGFEEEVKSTLVKLSESIEKLNERMESIEASLKTTSETHEKINAELKKVEKSLIDSQGTPGGEQTTYTKESLDKIMGLGGAI